MRRRSSKLLLNAAERLRARNFIGRAEWTDLLAQSRPFNLSAARIWSHLELAPDKSSKRWVPARAGVPFGNLLLPARRYWFTQVASCKLKAASCELCVSVCLSVCVCSIMMTSRSFWRALTSSSVWQLLSCLEQFLRSGRADRRDENVPSAATGTATTILSLSLSSSATRHGCLCPPSRRLGQLCDPVCARRLRRRSRHRLVARLCLSDLELMFARQPELSAISF